MSQIGNLQNEISISRRELKNIRQEFCKIQSEFRSQSNELAGLISQTCEIKDVKENLERIDDSNQENVLLSMKPIGVISSCFKNKNGIPRQPFLCQEAKAVLEITKDHFTNPEHSLIGLEDFSYIWILFYFHKNAPQDFVKAKIHPPRLDGASVGVFSTRSPHRPCAIGLSLVKLEKISGNKLYLSGVDVLDGTPVLDIKPYIESYDTPPSCENITKKGSVFQDLETNKDGQNYETEPEESSVTSTQKNQKMLQNPSESVMAVASKSDFISSDNDLSGKNVEDKHTNKIMELINEPPCLLNVIFTTRAESDLEKFHPHQDSCRCAYCLDFIGDATKARTAVIEVLKNDPRSVYRRNKCSDRLYFFEIDKMHVTAWFEENTAEILRVKSLSTKQLIKSKA